MPWGWRKKNRTPTRVHQAARGAQLFRVATESGYRDPQVQRVGGWTSFHREARVGSEIWRDSQCTFALCQRGQYWGCHEECNWWCKTLSSRDGKLQGQPHEFGERSWWRALAAQSKSWQSWRVICGSSEVSYRQRRGIIARFRGAWEWAIERVCSAKDVCWQDWGRIVDSWALTEENLRQARCRWQMLIGRSGEHWDRGSRKDGGTCLE